MPLVSVIVPNYNHAPYLRQRIESIINQTFQDFELILLDDCSSDNSKEILQEYQRHPKVSQVVFNDTNSGSPFKQWNKGIELAQGEYIWIAESDDWAENTFLETVIKAFNQYSDAGLAYTLARYMRQGVEQWSLSADNTIKIYSGVDFIKNKLLLSNVIYNVSMVVFQKKLYGEIDSTLYDKMRLCGDWFFYTLLCEHTNVLEICSIQSNYRMHDSNTSSRAEQEGLSFLEGLKILEYITCKYHISSKSYAFYWAKKWVKYRKQFKFSRITNKKIIKYTSKHFPAILIHYCVVRIVYFCKRK